MSLELLAGNVSAEIPYSCYENYFSPLSLNILSVDLQGV